MKNKKLLRRLLLVAAALVLIAIIAVIAIAGSKSAPAEKVGFIMTGAADDSGWNGMHCSGVRSACEKLGTELLIKENIAENSGECAEAIHQLSAEGAQMIILSSYGYPEEVKDVISEYPDIAFYGISSEYSAENMTSYFGRMYQARYLAGIIAGMQTESDSIGYVAAMPNNEVNRGINAFALGVRSVNPDADVYVKWTDSWEDEEKEISAAKVLISECGCDVITYHQNQHYVAATADAEGVYSIGYNQVTDGLSERYLTAAVWNWDSLYYEIIREFVQGRANDVSQRWFDISKGAVDLSELSPAVSEEARLAVEAARGRFNSGIDVFSGRIYDNNGVLRCEEGESLSDETLLNAMDWFVDGVVIYG